MQLYHLKVEGIPEYINMLKVAQKQAGRSGRTISDKTLLLFASTEMITTERYPRANNDWEDWSEANNTWSDWKKYYKREHTKAQVKAQSTEGSDQFGLANAAASIQNTSKVETNHGGDKVGTKSHERYFDNLAAAAVNEK